MEKGQVRNKLDDALYELMSACQIFDDEINTGLANRFKESNDVGRYNYNTQKHGKPYTPNKDK